MTFVKKKEKRKEKHIKKCAKGFVFNTATYEMGMCMCWHDHDLEKVFVPIGRFMRAFSDNGFKGIMFLMGYYFCFCCRRCE